MAQDRRRQPPLTDRSESDELAAKNTLLQTRLQELLDLKSALSLNEFMEPLQIEYDCQELLSEDMQEALAMSLRVKYNAKRGADGRHEMCLDAMKHLGGTGSCVVHKHPHKVASREKFHPENSQLEHQLVEYLDQLQEMVNGSTLARKFPGLAVSYRCTEVEKHGPETITMKLRVEYSAKPGAAVQHTQCIRIRRLLGVSGRCQVG